MQKTMLSLLSSVFFAASVSAAPVDDVDRTLDNTGGVGTSENRLPGTYDGVGADTIDGVYQDQDGDGMMDRTERSRAQDELNAERRERSLGRGRGDAAADDEFNSEGRNRTLGTGRADDETGAGLDASDGIGDNSGDDTDVNRGAMPGESEYMDRRGRGFETPEGVGTPSGGLGFGNEGTGTGTGSGTGTGAGTGSGTGSAGSGM